MTGTEGRTPPDRLHIWLPIGGRALVASDLFLTTTATTTSTRAAGALAAELRAVEGPGALVLAGNAFELTACAGGEGGTPPADVGGALEAHPELQEALEAFLAEESRRVVFLPGVRDRPICYDTEARSALSRRGLEVALSVDLTVATGRGEKVVRVEPGWAYDERSAFGDPTDPRDTPLAHHAVTELFPALTPSGSGWLEGVDRLQDPAGLPRFVASRLTYRRLGRLAWWLLVPLALVVVLGRLPGLWLFGAPDHIRALTRVLVDVAATLGLELVAAAALLAVVNHRLWRGPGSALLGPPAERANDAAREAARRFVASGGGGLVTGHSLRAEIAPVGRGFFANTGASATVVEERKALFGLPPVFVSSEQISFVTIEGGADLHARLTLSECEGSGGTLWERLAVGPRRQETGLEVVGSYPGASWPPLEDRGRRHRLVRRLAAALVFLIGALDIVTSLVPPRVRGTLHPYLGYVPLGASEAAGALVALFGVTLVLVARGLRRGQHLAFLVAAGVLSLTAILHLLREGQFVSMLASVAVLAALVWARDSFTAPYEPTALRSALGLLVGGAVSVPLVVTVVLEFGIRFDKDHGPLPWPTALEAALERLAGIDTVPLPRAAAVFLNPAELAIGVTIAVLALYVSFRPVAARHLGGRSPMGEGAAARAREIVTRRGRGTLDYFALRGDKEHFFDRDGLVAYAVHNGVALVSPDPICPPEERTSLFASFRRYADENGWAVAVLGAGQEWLPIYQAAGMRDLYIGDEAVVDVKGLSLEGGTKKGLRQAVNRIAKYGYTISFHDPSRIDPALARQLSDLMSKSRRGGLERGFSMTLGRIFEPSDKGLLLAVCHGPGEGAPPVAFCQFVPAPGIDGYSLDLMRRDPDDHPNGLLDFILVRTIERLRAEGRSGLGLNFATMRAVLAGESGDGLAKKLERFVLKRMSDTMQIESLWRFNAKFDPRWLPRYVVWDSAENSLAAALAIARAESFWELPIIGRFLTPPVPEPEEVQARGA